MYYMYGAETWANKRDTSHKIEVFHNRCIMGIAKARQCIGHISSVQIGEMFGMQESLEDIDTAKRLH